MVPFSRNLLTWTQKVMTYRFSYWFRLWVVVLIFKGQSVVSSRVFTQDARAVVWTRNWPSPSPRFTVKGRCENRNVHKLLAFFLFCFLFWIVLFCFVVFLHRFNRDRRTITILECCGHVVLLGYYWHCDNCLFVNLENRHWQRYGGALNIAAVCFASPHWGVLFVVFSKKNYCVTVCPFSNLCRLLYVRMKQYTNCM